MLGSGSFVLKIESLQRWSRKLLTWLWIIVGWRPRSVNRKNHDWKGKKSSGISPSSSVIDHDNSPSLKETSCSWWLSSLQSWGKPTLISSSSNSDHTSSSRQEWPTLVGGIRLPHPHNSNPRFQYPCACQLKCWLRARSIVATSCKSSLTPSSNMEPSARKRIWLALTFSEQWPIWWLRISHQRLQVWLSI